MAAVAERPILSWHAHVYFDPPSTRPHAERVRSAIGRRFRVQLGRWHEAPIGPHTAAMYEVAFDVDVFAGLVPWLALHRQGLSVLVHPNTLAPHADHLENDRRFLARIDRFRQHLGTQRQRRTEPERMQHAARLTPPVCAAPDWLSSIVLEELQRGRDVGQHRGSYAAEACPCNT